MIANRAHHYVLLICMSLALASLVPTGLSHSLIAADETIEIEVVAVHVKGGAASGFVVEGTPVLVIGPMDSEPMQFSVTQVGKSGAIEHIKIQRNKQYGLYIDTLSPKKKRSKHDYVPVVMRLRITTSGLGNHIVAESISAYDFRSVEMLSAKLLVAMQLLETGVDAVQPQEFTAAKSSLRTFTKLILNKFPAAATNDFSEITKRIVAVRGDTIEVVGVAESLPSESGFPLRHSTERFFHGPYMGCNVYAFAPTGVDVVPFSNSGVVATNATGEFTLALPADVVVTLVIDAEYDPVTETLTKPPKYIDLSPKQFPVPRNVGFDTRVTVNDQHLSVSDADQSMVFGRFMTEAAAKSDNPRQRDRLVAASQKFRSAVARSAKLNLVSCLYGPEPDADWDRVLQSANRYPSTVFWVIVKPDLYGAIPGWESRFWRYSDQQFRKASVETPSVLLPRSNFRMVGYVSLWAEDGAKPNSEVLSEVKLWATASEQHVTGVFLDNLFRTTQEQRAEIREEIKKLYGPDFAVFGACGNPVVEDQLESSVASALDTIFLEKNVEIDFPLLKSRIADVSEGHSTVLIGGISLGVDQSEWQSTLKQHVDAGVRFVSVTDFAPRPGVAEEQWFDAPFSLPAYWDELSEYVDLINKDESK